LSEGEDFDGGIVSTAKEDLNGHKKSDDDLEHKSVRLIRRNVASPRPTLRNRKLLISSHRRLLSTDNGFGKPGDSAI
jgi:hypothetical protein